MTSTVNKTSPVAAELTVEVPKQEIKSAFDKAYATLGRTTQIRGFRKGRVPRAVLRRMFGQMVGSDVLKEVLPKHLELAIKEHDLDVIGQPEIDAKDVDENNDYSFVVKVELRPTLEAISFDDIELVRYTIPIGDDDIQSELQRLQSSVAQVIDLEQPRPAANDDMVKLTMKVWRDGEWQEFSSKEQSVIIGNNPFGEKFDAAVIGLNVGDEKVIDLGSEDDMDSERVRYLVNVSSIQGRELPALDDEFAKDLGEFDTLDDLKSSIREGLERGIKRTEDQRLSTELFKALAEKNPVALPPNLVERQTYAIHMNMEGQRAQMGGEPMAVEERKESLEKARQAAEAMVHQFLLSQEFARLENISVEDPELDDELDRLAKEQRIPLPMLKAEYNKDERKDQLRNQLLERKLFDFALTKVKIIEKDVSELKAEAENKTEKETQAKAGARAGTKDSAKPVKKTATKKTAAKKTATKKTAAKKTAAKKTAAKKTTGGDDK